MPTRITVVLSTIFTTYGGIPKFNQMLCLALDSIAPRLDLEVAILSQDDTEEHYRSAGSPWTALRFIGCGGQLGTVVQSIKRCLGHSQDLMLVGLVGMTPVGLLCSPRLRLGFGFIAHGTEVWDEPRRSRLFAARRARFGLAVSSHTQAAVVRTIGLDPSQVLWLPNTLPPGYEEVEQPTFAPRADGTVEVLTVSRLWAEEGQKGVDHTLHAIASLAESRPELRYRVVGKGSDKPRLQALAEDLGIAARVIWEENLSDDDLALRYRECDIFAMPSGQEGFGIVFLEAMRYGKPCVGGNAGGTPDVISDGESGFLVPFADREALSAALGQLLDDPSLRRSLGAGGRARMKRLFTFPAFEQRVEAHLRALLDLPPMPSEPPGL